MPIAILLSSHPFFYSHAGNNGYDRYSMLSFISYHPINNIIYTLHHDPIGNICFSPVKDDHHQFRVECVEFKKITAVLSQMYVLYISPVGPT